MLVLTRRTNQSVVLPALGITIRVNAIKGQAVRIGIEAPRDVAICREELLALARKGKEADQPCHVTAG